MSKQKTALLGFLVAALWMTSAIARTYHVCIGENSGEERGSRCPQSQVYAYCHTPIGTVAAQLCAAEGASGAPTLVHERTEDGNRCEYEFWQVSCQ